MTEHRVTASKLINSSPERVYSLLADYHDGHQHILPNPPFVSFDVEEGGIGAGTVVRFKLRLLGRTQSFRAHVSEPEPGRRLVETNDDASVTTFTVESQDQGRRSLVAITTETRVRAGILGVIEGWLTTRLLLPVYRRELDQLEALAKERTANI
jgi:hypothetical protein